MATTTDVELKLALEMGYKVSFLYEKHTWAKWSNTMFRDFITKHLKVKMQASAPPADEQERLRMIGEALEIYGIDLNDGKWETNAGLRYLAKLYLNSAWG